MIMARYFIDCDGLEDVQVSFVTIDALKGFITGDCREMPINDVLCIKFIHGRYKAIRHDANFDWQIFTCQSLVAYKKVKMLQWWYISKIEKGLDN